MIHPEASSSWWVNGKWIALIQRFYPRHFKTVGRWRTTSYWRVLLMGFCVFVSLLRFETWLVNWNMTNWNMDVIGWQWIVALVLCTPNEVSFICNLQICTLSTKHAGTSWTNVAWTHLARLLFLVSLSLCKGHIFHATRIDCNASECVKASSCGLYPDTLSILFY